MSEFPKKKRKVIRPFEMILLVLSVLLLINFGLKSVGVDTVKRSEEVRLRNLKRILSVYTHLLWLVFPAIGYE